VRELQTNHAGLHQLLTLQVLVSLVGPAHASTVDAPALLGAIALLGLELAISLTLWVVNAVVVHEACVWFSSDSTCGQAFLGTVHLSLHQVALGNQFFAVQALFVSRSHQDGTRTRGAITGGPLMRLTSTLGISSNCESHEKSCNPNLHD